MATSTPSPLQPSSASLRFLSSSPQVRPATPPARPSRYQTDSTQELLQRSPISPPVLWATKTVASTPSLPQPSLASLPFPLNSPLTRGGMPPAPPLDSPTASSPT